MVNSISNTAAVQGVRKPVASVAAVAAPQVEVAKAKLETGKKAVPSASELNAKAFMQRQQIGAALYDRSFTFGEGISALKRQDAIASYAAKIQSQDGGPTAKQLQALDRKLDRAETQITKLSNNAKGADLDSLEAIDGKELDTVQENLMARINAGLKDGSLTEEEGKGLLARQEELNKLEVKFRESDGKLTAGEQKQMLDQLRKEADAVNRLRHNNNGVNLTYKSYSDQIDARQASLEKQIEAGIKRGSLTAKEAEAVKAEFASAAKFEEELRADGRVDWKDSVKMSTALNDVEIALYDLERNKQGVQLKDSFVDVKHVDGRQAQHLESTARGISNKALTDDEGIELLDAQRDIQNKEDRFLKGDGKLDRAEFLKLQNDMNDFALRNHELQTNKDRWTGIMSEAKPAVVPPATGGVKPAPAVQAPVAPVKPEAPVAVAPQPEPVKPDVAAPVAPVAPAPAPVTGEARVEWNAGNALKMQAYDAKADKWIDVASKGRGENPAFNTTVKLSQDVIDGGRFRIIDGNTVLENGRKSTNADGSVTIRFNDTGADQDFNDALITFKPSVAAEPVKPEVAAPVVEAPKAEVKVEEKKADEAKPEANSSGGGAAVGGGDLSALRAKYNGPENNFGKLVSGMLKSVNDGVAKFGQEVSDRAREKNEDMKERATEVRSENLGFGDVRVKAYTKLDKPLAAATELLRKIA